ncbi:hypothetical protein [Hominiventricola aquisgranensis]|uniref:Uncharacterized protein n=1 Tax=Hominiventricola aquisgranensis TaxID=3133164 RepID=A0ABV1HYJ0_9FIRM|nr:hypothetical protein DWX14_08305 [Clostridiaceae bacterium AF18-31LB]RHT84016.1 hypothetical protein DW725_04570 [Clostridiaceae bacterium AM27-36LB]
MKDVRDELVKLVYKTVFICIAVFIIAVFVKDYYLNYLFGLLFYPLNKYIKFVLTFFICFWPFISAIMILLRATWFIIKNILLADVTFSKEYFFFFAVAQIIMAILIIVATISSILTNTKDLLC